VISNARWSLPRPSARAALVVLCVALAAACAEAERPRAVDGAPFRLGFLPADRDAEFGERADSLAAYLSRAMGNRVDVFVPTTYEPLVEALRHGSLEAAFMDAAPAWIAHQRAGAEAVLAEIGPDGNTYYWAVGYTRASSDIDSLDDLVGKRSAHTSWTGASGFILPVAQMIRDGVVRPATADFQDLQTALEETFASVTVAGGYGAAMELLVNGQVDVAFGADDAAERFLSAEDRVQVREFVRLGRVPSHPVMVARHVSPARREAFVAAMLDLTRQRPDLFRDLYGVEGVVTAGTEQHLGEFGRSVDALQALHGELLRGR
jgi:phosphonate transport system substrate-binding protein